MKRATQKSPMSSVTANRLLDPRRLSAARGGHGGGLDIAVRIAAPLAPDMQNQHNEQLVAL